MTAIFYADDNQDLACYRCGNGWGNSNLVRCDGCEKVVCSSCLSADICGSCVEGKEYSKPLFIRAKFGRSVWTLSFQQAADLCGGLADCLAAGKSGVLELGTDPDPELKKVAPAPISRPAKAERVETGPHYSGS